MVKKNIERNIQEIYKPQIVASVAEKLNLYKSDVERVYDSIEETTMKLLSSADEDRDVFIRLFNGVILSATFSPIKKRNSPALGGEIIIQPKLKFKASFTQYFKTIKTKEFRANRTIVSNWLARQQAEENAEKLRRKHKEPKSDE